MNLLDLNRIENLSIKRLIDRNTCEILETSDTGLFVRDTVGGAYMLSNGNYEEGKLWLMKHRYLKYGVLAICDAELIDYAAELYKPSNTMLCYQYAYLKDTIDIPRGELTVRTADNDDFQWLSSVYDLVSAEELRRDVELGNILIASVNGADVGFVGEHLEGSMGLLHILPEFRRRGYAEELESLMIADTLRRGFVPFCQTELDNYASIHLQEKLGLVKADNITGWLWKE